MDKLPRLICKGFMMESRAAIFLGRATDGSGSDVKKSLMDFYFNMEPR